MSFGDVHLGRLAPRHRHGRFGRFNPREVRSRRIRVHDSLLSRTPLSHPSSTFLPSARTRTMTNSAGPAVRGSLCVLKIPSTLKRLNLSDSHC